MARWRTPAPLQVELTNPDSQTRLTIPDFIRIRRALKAGILAELDRTDVVEERARLQARIDELTRQINDPEGAFEAERQRLADLEEKLIHEGDDLGAERLQSAIDALRRGETDQAEAIFAEIVAREALAVQRAARAEYGLGEIAEGRVDWADAARHYARAAELDPSFDHLLKASEFVWRAGDFGAALRYSEDLLGLARNGNDQLQLGAALNAHAITLQAEGRFAEAEPLYRHAVEISRETLDPRHRDLAVRLSNLAGLLVATGRYDEAESLSREALEIDRERLGSRHVNVWRSLANLAVLLRATGQLDEAKPLLREALEIGRETLGPGHPDVAHTLNNLAALLEDMSRIAEAEPLYREALEIRREALGPRHPAVAATLHNLAGLLEATGRAGEATPLYPEALGIFCETLGDAHPNTRIAAGNTLRHLREHAPDHPDLPGLAEAFPDL
ncbi:tetratricopeptide repeat protein [Rhodobacteraceae bacterium 2376]|uniref:Tetratricopeptide repeat protein n=1 Tax=Rhabdonatronobacter sediminivivens TaxID=2743469 RepID=A0A7Z0HY34_9RHOB|nr:tetratricopeptide repeat protein [Rhabdonatronobacter sediminivivens]NYS23999.1 tetratricopeptide repeat protein [Rhabdonatronobacter sediminivivens]